MEEIKNWIIDWFEKNSTATKTDIENNPEENYFNTGWIDSFAFINFISDIEEKFKISFSNDEFQNRDFATINGLTKIIKGKLDA